MDSTTERFLKRIKETIETQKTSMLNTRFTELNSYNYTKGKLDAFEESLEIMRHIIQTENNGDNDDDWKELD